MAVQVESLAENPLLPKRTVKYASRCFKNGGATRIFPWRFQPEVKSAPLVRLEGRWTNFLFYLNFACGPMIFVPTAVNAFYGIFFLDWGEMEQMLCIPCLSAMSLPMVGGVVMLQEKICFRTMQESLKHVDFLNGFLQPKSAQTPKLVRTSQMALEAVVLMSYSNTISAALSSVLVPWLPLAFSNAIELALGYEFTYPWKTVVKMFDFGAICYVGHQCAEHAFGYIMAFHCFSVCNTVVLRDFMLTRPKLVNPAVAKQYDDVVQIWRRIQILNLGINQCFATTTLSLQITAIGLATGGAFAAIKIEGVTGIGLGSFAVFIVIILVVLLQYSSLLGETMVETKAELERRCRGDALLRRQIRSLKPAFLTAGSFYYVDKGCIVTCVSMIIDNVVNALVMANN